MIVKPLEQLKENDRRDIVICVEKQKGKANKYSYASAFKLGSQWRYYKTSDAWQHQKWLAQHYLGIKQSKSIIAFSTDTATILANSGQRLVVPKGQQPKLVKLEDIMPKDLNYVIFDDKEYSQFNKLLKDKKQEDKVFADYKKQWDEASIKYCFEKGDLARAGTLDSTRASYLNRQFKDNKLAIRRKLFDKLIAKYPEIKYNKYNNNKEDNTMAKQGLYALATIIDKDKNESFEMKQVSNENKKVEAGLFSKTVKAKHADCTVEVQLVKFRRTVY